MAEGIRQDGSPLARFVGSGLRKERFVLLDIGASGGIDSGWRSFAPRLTAYGFDPSIAECERLNAAEADPEVSYIPAFVAAPKDGHIATARAGRAPTLRNPWNRLAVAATMERQQAQLTAASDRERMEANAWTMTKLADPAAPVIVPSFLEERNIQSVDFIKIDIDGDDFDVLQTLDGAFQPLGILGVAIEVNFIGGVEPHEHTFHNTDRYLRKNGFDLCALSTRPYANAALPSRYQLKFPAQSATGRPLQGDAIYVRDVFQDGDSPEMLSDEKLLKLAAVYSLLNLPDMGAEVFVRAATRLSQLVDVKIALDMLAAQSQALSPVGPRPLTYEEYIAAFNRNDPMFYP